jgi:hypothetical protein
MLLGGNVALGVTETWEGDSLLVGVVLLRRPFDERRHRRIGGTASLLVSILARVRVPLRIIGTCVVAPIHPRRRLVLRAVVRHGLRNGSDVTRTLQFHGHPLGHALLLDVRSQGWEGAELVRDGRVWDPVLDRVLRVEAVSGACRAPAVRVQVPARRNGWPKVGRPADGPKAP